jgi:hypothetical protein
MAYFLAAKHRAAEARLVCRTYLYAPVGVDLNLPETWKHLLGVGRATTSLTSTLRRFPLDGGRFSW